MRCTDRERFLILLAGFCGQRVQQRRGLIHSRIPHYHIPFNTHYPVRHSVRIPEPNPRTFTQEGPVRIPQYTVTQEGTVCITLSICIPAFCSIRITQHSPVCIQDAVSSSRTSPHLTGDATHILREMRSNRRTIHSLSWGAVQRTDNSMPTPAKSTSPRMTQDGSTGRE